MSALEPLCHLLYINTKTLSKIENLLLEAELFDSLCSELNRIFCQPYKGHFSLMQNLHIMENNMFEVTRLIINDILSTNEYTLQGIARYTGIHEDVIEEVIMGLNVNPSIMLFRKIIELHRNVRREIYQSIVNKLLQHHDITIANPKLNVTIHGHTRSDQGYKWLR